MKRAATAILVLGFLIALAVTLSITLFRPTAASQKKVGPAPLDVSKLVGPDRCGECHGPEQAVWKQSRHQLGYKEMHRMPAAKEIAERLGIRRIKSAPECLSCHYTPQERNGKRRAATGVSCESCHGPAAEWMDVHDDFGGQDFDIRTETPQHRQKREKQCVELGMYLPGRIVDLARQCFDCHAVSDEKLVNVGGHPPGADFELLTWTQGEIRHNFSGGAENREASPERRRLLYVVGQLLALEYALRDVSVAREDGAFRDGARARLSAARAKLLALEKALGDTPGLAGVLAAVPAADADSAVLDAAAERVRIAAGEFVANQSPSAWNAIDSLLPPASAYRGEPRKSP